jgi:hypothetical protein
MKKLRLAGLLAALALSGWAQSGGEAKAPSVTLRGEVVDLHCYITRGAKGPDHTGCGNACLSRGVSAGFLAEDGVLYVLLSEKPFSAKDAVAGLVGAPATAKGQIVERGGVKALQLASIERRSAS